MGTGDPLSFTTTGAGVTVDLLAGKNVECTFLNTKPSPTRTQGFWQTHTNFTSEVFQTVLASPMPIGISPHKGLITTPKQLFGAYYSSIPKKSDGTKRSPLDQARMQLLQQLVTAKLNCAAFGCAASALSLITTADTNYAGTDKAAILASASALDTFNNSGDTIIISPPLPSPGKATPTDSKNLAAGAGIQFWDTP
ncbi:hypothetical protein A3A78_02390 [candidate division WWE3 bacterium RIFCSPLOWO2_01_FULL_41_18]|uniref:Uncharacterized protein n=1 Tax=candidate division WWE3 bacterium RIFCSPLOWO2_01_FULL_41_18 TaxID=1802625 RepID=A0A1F4VGK3_UNCKA|nr:MAG: hypothetical protein A3A78_02390 [candidate division WWE3 bacterium RIFCSPLOWO2_01_FULL_41_18]